MLQSLGRRHLAIVALAGFCGFAVLAISLGGRGDAAFPGLNGKIGYSNGQSYASQSIYAANSDGSSPVGLTSGTNDFWPSYSADGSKIAFNRLSNIVVMNADGSGQVQIANGTKTEGSSSKWQSNYEAPYSAKIIPEVKIETRTRVGHSFYNPSFLPEGAQLVVAEQVFDRTQEIVCAVENPGDEECLDYEDEGSYFHYDSECNNCYEHIVTMDATTGAVTGQVTPGTQGVSDFSPTASADGRIAFGRYAQGSPSGSGIFVVSSPGGAPAQLTSGNGNYEPDFSPDSSKLIFVHGEREFGVIGVGGGPITILSLPAPPAGSYMYVASPKYSPDGTQVVFYQSLYSFSPFTEEHGLYVMGGDSSNPHRILEGYDPTWQPVPPPPPPPPTPVVAKAKKGKLKLSKKNEAVVGTITCGSSPCKLKVLSALLKVREPKSKGKGGKHQGKASTAGASKKKGHKAGSKTYKVKAIVPKKLAPGKTAKVKVKVTGKALAALRKAGKGALTVKVKVTEGLGKKVLTMKSTLKPPKPKKSKKHH